MSSNSHLFIEWFTDQAAFHVGYTEYLGFGLFESLGILAHDRDLWHKAG